MALKRSPSGLHDDSFVFLPNDLLTDGFRRVGYRRVEKELEVVFQCSLPNGEEMNTCVAIDASESMRPLWGKVLTGDIPLTIQERYHRQKFVLVEEREGAPVLLYLPEAYEDAIANGYLKWTTNEIEGKVREILSFLAAGIDSRGTCNLLYWGCEKGAGWMDLGEIQKEDCDRQCVPGLETFAFGKESRLLPLVQYIVASSADVPKTMVVILTDGRISDIEDLQSYSSNLALLIKAGHLHFMKFVVLTMGSDVDTETLGKLAGMSIGGGLDLWEIKSAKDLADYNEITAGLALKEQIVAPKTLVFDLAGNVVKEFKDGLPEKGRFRMSQDSTGFIMQVAESTKIFRQSLLLPFQKELG